MRTYAERERTSTSRVLAALSCDRCGKDCTYSVGEWGAQPAGASFSIDFGYGSEYDLETWSFDLCDGCVTEFRDEWLTARAASAALPAPPLSQENT